MKPLRIACVVLAIAGACLLGRAAYLHAKAELAGILIARAWEKNVETGKPQKPWPWADTHPIARLRIPRLGYDEYVLEDASARNLAFGPARLLSGAAVGESGNLVIAGHRTSWFRPLEGIKSGPVGSVRSKESNPATTFSLNGSTLVRTRCASEATT